MNLGPSLRGYDVSESDETVVKGLVDGGEVVVVREGEGDIGSVRVRLKVGFALVLAEQNVFRDFFDLDHTGRCTRDQCLDSKG